MVKRPGSVTRPANQDEILPTARISIAASLQVGTDRCMAKEIFVRRGDSTGVELHPRTPSGTARHAYVVTPNISFDTAARSIGHDDPNPLLRVVDIPMPGGPPAVPTQTIHAPNMDNRYRLPMRSAVRGLNWTPGTTVDLVRREDDIYDVRRHDPTASDTAATATFDAHMRLPIGPAIAFDLRLAPGTAPLVLRPNSGDAIVLVAPTRLNALLS
jgi:hypothetical protein